MGDAYDALERRDPAQRSADQFLGLRTLLESAREAAPGWARRLDGAALETVTDRAALARLPLLRKSELTELQTATPPFGGLTTRRPESFTHMFMSPGPIFEPGADAADWWRFARALHALGLRRGDAVHNSFAYHLTPAGMMVDSGARALGCPVLPAGIGQTEQQARAAAAVRPVAYVGTPDYLKALLEKGDELELALDGFRLALVSGGALFPSLRQWYADRGILCLQAYATADLGLIAYETIDPATGGPCPGMVVDEGVILEIVRPGTSEPVPDGEVGEVVVTSLNADYPLLRFATGDMSAMMPEPSPCGRTGPRIRGWMGRADQRTKIKGMFVDPAQVAEVVRAHDEVARARVVVSRDGEADVFVLRAEASSADPALAGRIAQTVAAAFKLRGDVELVDPGALPNDGVVIEDARDYDK